MYKLKLNQDRRRMKLREAIKRMAGGGAIRVKWGTEAIQSR